MGNFEQGVIQFVWVLSTLFLQFTMGQQLVSFMRRRLQLPSHAPTPLNCLYYFSLGLLAHLWMAFLLKQYLQAPWWIAGLLPLLPSLFGVRASYNVLRKQRIVGSLNFLLWFFIVVSLGTTLMQALNGIETPWSNNYGDLTWHLGIISNFVLGDRFPIEYHIYPGISLSYPFFVNFWSALLWWPNPEYSSLALIFNLQWTIAWIAVFIILRGNEKPMLPWALLFAGGAYHLLGAESWKFIQSGHPWTVFVSSVWVPQRAAMMGVLIACLAIRIFLEARVARGKVESWFMVFQASLLLSAASLVHTHFVVSCGLFIFVSLLLSWIAPMIKLQSPLTVSRDHVLAFFAGLIPGLLALPHLVGKSHLAEFTLGWTGVTPQADATGQLIASLGMWAQDAWPIIIVFAFFCLFTKDLFHFIVLTICFIAFNMVELAAWEWDQLKFFIGLYIVILCLISMVGRPRSAFLQLACVLLVIPGFAESYRVFLQGPQFEVFSADAVGKAYLVESNTDRDAIIAAKPDHNHPILLSGRRIYYGYEGTLWSHGLDREDIQQRQKINSSLRDIANCVHDGSYGICPTHIYFSQLEQSMWNAEELAYYFSPTSLPFLYTIRE